MSDAGQLSVNDRVLIHLSRFATDMPPEEYPPECAQTGIASAVGISRTHVPRAVKGLIKDGLVVELTARVKGHERRMNVYAVTAEGMRRTDDLWKSALENGFVVAKNGATVTMTGKAIEDLVGRKRALAVISQMRDGVVAIDETRRAPIRDITAAPSVREFYGRDAELDAMEAFMESNARMLVVLGNKGYGTSSLARKFVDEQDDQDVLWIHLTQETTAEGIRKKLADFAKRTGQDVSDMSAIARLGNLILIFDDYYMVGEDVVELFAELVEMDGEAKIVFTAREETPAYNWFYHKDHVDSKIVQELRLHGLDEPSAKRLLGNDRIEKDAFKRIIMMTRGQPLILKLLRERDLAALKSNTMFTPEEIRYMLFLRDKNE